MKTILQIILVHLCLGSLLAQNTNNILSLGEMITPPSYIRPLERPIYFLGDLHGAGDAIYISTNRPDWASLLVITPTNNAGLIESATNSSVRLVRRSGGRAWLPSSGANPQWQTIDDILGIDMTNFLARIKEFSPYPPPFVERLPLDFRYNFMDQYSVPLGVWDGDRMVYQKNMNIKTPKQLRDEADAIEEQERKRAIDLVRQRKEYDDMLARWKEYQYMIERIKEVIK